MGVIRSFLGVAGLHVLVIVATLGYEMYNLMRSHFKYAVPGSDQSKTMRAMVFSEFGNASVIHERKIAQPKCCSSIEVKVKVSAAALNPVDFKYRRNSAPSLVRPLPTTTGFDFCGVVDEVGSKVTGFRVGDRVYGMLPLMGSPWGTVQEYIVIDASTIALAPKSVSCKEAASLPLVSLTVLHALEPVIRDWRKRGETPTSKKVLIQAGSGGVGSFAIQYVAKVLGARVVTTTSAKNADFVRELGADQVVDYRSQRFEDEVKECDLVLDSVTQEYEARTLASKTVLKQGGVGHYINVFSTDWQPNARETNQLALMVPLLKKWAYHVMAHFFIGVYYHCNPVSPDGKGLGEIAQWVDQKLILPIVDKSYAFEEVARAHEHLETGHVRGKLVIEVGGET